MKKKVICVIGTRPEAIKMAPVISQLNRTSWAQVYVVATAQHREMLDQMLALFNIKIDVDLNIMQPNQGLATLTARLTTELDKIFAREAADIVLAQGDTTSVFVAALASFYQKIPFCHVEAGLRTYNMDNPFPEELNRVMIGRLARLHFAPTEIPRNCLLKEGVAADSIHVTGNTVIDALLQVAQQEFKDDLGLDKSKRLILLTTHRRESFGAPLTNIFQAIIELVTAVEDVEVLYPVHPNPNVHSLAHQMLGNHPRIKLCAPLDYQRFVAAMKQAYLIVTDSGGVQEEAPALGKPVLVVRNETERVEAVQTGVAKLVGTDKDVIFAESMKLLSEPALYAKMVKSGSPYGDGHAAERIVQIMQQQFC